MSKVSGDVFTDEVLRSKLQTIEDGLKNASSANQLRALEERIEAQKSTVDDELHHFCLEHKTSHESQIRALEMSRIELSYACEKSKQLSEMLAKTSNMSSKITAKVRILDTEASKLQKLKQYVDNVRSLKCAIQEVDESIRHEKWKEAAVAVEIIRKLPDGLLEDEYVKAVVPSTEISDMPTDLLPKWIESLKQTFTKGFEKASDARNAEQITYFFQLFPLIGEQEIGLKCYSKFVCTIISEQSREILKDIQGKSNLKQNFYADILFQFYQTIASIVNQHSPLIKKFYGKDALRPILTRIQAECDLQSGMILDIFLEARKIDEVVDQIQNYSYPKLVDIIYNHSASLNGQLSDGESSTSPNRMSLDHGVRESIDASVSQFVLPSLADIGKLTDELSAMMNHWEMYSKFYAVSWNNSFEKPSLIPGNDTIYPFPLVSSPFLKKISETATVKFDVLCTFAVRRTLEKACEIEEIPALINELSTCVKYLSGLHGYSSRGSSSGSSLQSLIPEDAPISSIVDDMTMSLNVILTETLSTGQLISIKAMMSNVKRIISSDFINVFTEKFNSIALRNNATLLTPKNLLKVQESLTGQKAQLDGEKQGVKGLALPDIPFSGMALVKSINKAISIASEEVGAGAEAGAKALGGYIVALNSISSFAQYLKELADHLVDYLERQGLLIIDDQVYKRTLQEMEEPDVQIQPISVNLKSQKGSKLGPSVQDRIESVIRSLGSDFGDKADEILTARIEYLFDTVIRSNTIEMISEAFPENSYMASSETFSGDANNASERVVTFLEQWNKLVVPYLATLTKQNFRILIRLIVKVVASSLESKIWKMNGNCNELGAASLERDVSLLIIEITRFDYTLRESFVRVTQIIMLMGLDDDEDIDDLQDLDWALTPSERVRARNLRLDRS